MAKVSVIIPTHNRPHLLPRAVESARAAGTDVEIIVVDDASLDETADVCRAIDDIRYIRSDRNQGVAGARNLGLVASTARYIAFLDDDDLRLPGSLDHQFALLEANPEAGFVCGPMLMADQNYLPTGAVSKPTHAGGDAFWELLELDFPVMPLSVLIRKECLLSVGLLNCHLNGIDDWDIFVRMAELYPVLVSERPAGLYRQPTPVSGQGSSIQAAQLRRAARHQLRLLRLPRALSASAGTRKKIRRQAMDRIADTLLWNAARRLPKGDFGFASANIFTALRLNPLRLLRPEVYRKLVSRMIEPRRG